MSKYLDSNGLLYLWSKIKTLVTAKVDKVDGKALSSNDYTDTEKSKLAGIAAGANAYTHPTSDGNKHVPATGTGNNGKFLRAGSTAGSAAWGTLAKADVTTALGYTPENATTAASTYATKTELGLCATKTELTNAITGMYKYKGAKATVSALPTSGNTLGDVWDVQSDGHNYAWNGTDWDDLGGTFTIEVITNSDIDTVAAS